MDTETIEALGNLEGSVDIMVVEQPTFGQQVTQGAVQVAVGIGTTLAVAGVVTLLGKGVQYYQDRKELKKAAKLAEQTKETEEN